MMAPYSQASLGHHLISVIWIFDREGNYRCLEYIKACGFTFYTHLSIHLLTIETAYDV